MTCPISGETAEEERINYWTHLVGLILSLIGGSILLWASSQHDYFHKISAYTYTITLIGLYGASTFYHRCSILDKKKRWKVIDHSCIYLFIAGSYTPFTLGPLRDSHGPLLLVIVWSIAIIGILFKIFAIKFFQKISLFSYLLMGWLIIFSLPTLIQHLSFQAILWLMLGGLSYTAGTIFYAWDKLPYSHGIWHLFVLTGTACHYCTILDFMVL